MSTPINTPTSEGQLGGADLRSLTIRELVAELTRIEDRLNNARAAARYHPSPETARLERRMRAICTHLRARRSASRAGDHPPADADEADLIEQSMPVDADPDEEYPHQDESPLPEARPPRPT
ncbi:hypothetical protein [Flexivirga sp.]|uniref:hypothetical protein n=1 Tax=Flexivirga sp. TaxID=1962927 RepID=UPI003F7E85F8